MRVLSILYGVKSWIEIVGLSIRHPCDGDPPLTQAFGITSITGSIHQGLDWSLAYQPLHAVLDGVVQSTYPYGKDMPGLESDGSPGGYGSTVLLKHNVPGVGTIYSYYCHLSQIDVRTGDPIEQGQVIGVSGTTGISTGPHLHFELRLADVATRFDPLPFIGEEVDDVLPEDRALLDWVASNKGALSTLAIAAREAAFDAAHDTSATNDAVSRGIRRLTKLLKGVQLTEAQILAMSGEELRGLLFELINVEVPA